jgi:hypothetical protein
MSYRDSQALGLPDHAINYCGSTQTSFTLNFSKSGHRAILPAPTSWLVVPSVLYLIVANY